MIDKYGFSIEAVPPIGLAYIAASIKDAGFDVYAIDAVGESPRQYNPVTFTPNLTVEYKKGRLYTNGLSNEEIIDRIAPDTTVIGLSCMFSNNWLADRKLIADLKAAFPDILIIAGGESISAKPELWLAQAPGLEVCVIGEGEETIRELLQALHLGTEWREVTGIAYRDINGNIVTTAKRAREKNIENIPWPAWEYFPIKNYMKYKLQYTVSTQHVMPIVATRGCPYSCTFCSSPQMWGTKYVMRTPEDVVNEIQHLIDNYQVDEIDFYDLTAIIKRDWIIAFAKEVIAREINIKWNIPAGTRSEAIDDEVARYLYLSGCKDITYAPESGSPRMLKLIKKKVVLDQMIASMKASNKNNMRIYINMILGIPGERHNDIWKTIWFLVRGSWAGAYEVGIAMFHPYPGSELFEKLLKEKRIDLDSDDFFYNIVTISPIKKSDFHYNPYVSAGWYHFYNILSYLVFFGTNYIFRPLRLFKMARNVLSKTYKSRFERTISRILHNERPGEKRLLNQEEAIIK